MPPAAELDCPKAAAEPNKTAEQTALNMVQGVEWHDGNASANIREQGRAQLSHLAVVSAMYAR